MLSFVTGAGQKFADSTEQVIADSGGYGPVGTTMALLEASSKFFSAIHKRLHKAQGDEFKVLARIDSEYLPNEYPYDLPGITEKIFKADFDSRVDIIPVSDPNIPSNAQRMMLIQMVQQVASQSAPGMFDMEAINRMLLTTANVPDVDKLMPIKEEVQPHDAMTDILRASEGKPIKAFEGQNHDAHVAVKTAFLQDPMNQQRNPAFKMIAAVLQDNITEHMMLKYKEQMMGLYNQSLQNPQIMGQIALDPSVIEQVQAQAAQQILQANAAAAQGPGTPEQQMLAIEAQKLQVEQNKTAAQIAKAQADAALKNRDLDLKEQKIVLDTQAKGAQEQMRAYQKQEDRDAKRALKAMDVLADLLKAQENNDLEEAKVSAKLLADVIKQQGIE